MNFMSLPSRERGLKCQCSGGRNKNPPVAPLAGAWIEISCLYCLGRNYWVAPLAGAWIEIILEYCIPELHMLVAPLAGAWIEICIL